MPATVPLMSAAAGVEESRGETGCAEVLPERGKRLPVLIVVALLGVQFAVFWALARRSYFFADDLLFFQLARNADLDVDYLGRSAFGHFVPLFHLTNWVFERAFGVSYAIGAALMAAAWTVASVVMLRALRALGCPAPATYVLTGVFAFSLIAINSASWWSAVVCLYTSTALNVACLAAAQRWLVAHRIRSLVAAGTTLLVACLFWEKSLLVVAYVFVFTVVVSDRGQPLRARVRRALSRWPLWLVLGLVATTYLVLYAQRGYGAQAGPAPSPRAMLAFLHGAWFESFWPSLIGFTPPRFLLFGSVGATAVAGQVALIALVAFLMWSRGLGPTLAPACFFVACFALNMAILGRTRVSYYGADVGWELRYHFDNLWLLVVAVGAVLAAPARVGRGAAATGPAPRRRLVRRSVALGAILLVGVLVAVGSQSALAVTDRALSPPGTTYRSPGRTAHLFFANLRASIDELDRSGEAITLFDRPVPGPVAFAPYYPYNLDSRLFELFGWDLTYVHDDATPLIVTDTGRIEPARFVASTPDLQPWCFDPGGGTLELALPEPLPDGTWVVHFERSAASPAEIGLQVVDQAGVIREGQDDRRQPVDAGTADYLATLRRTSISTLRILVSSDDPFCVRDVAIGDVVPDAR